MCDLLSQGFQTRGLRQHQYYKLYLKLGSEVLLAHIAARGDTFLPYPNREFFFLQNVVLAYI